MIYVIPNSNINMFILWFDSAIIIIQTVAGGRPFNIGRLVVNHPLYPCDRAACLENLAVNSVQLIPEAISIQQHVYKVRGVKPYKVADISMVL